MITNDKFIKKLNRNFVKKNLIFPYDFDDTTNILKVAVPTAQSFGMADNLSNFFEKKIQINIFEQEYLNRIIDNYYLENIADEVEITDTEVETENNELEIISEIKRNDLLYETNVDEPIIKLVNSFVITAIRNSATDIHIEPYETKVMVRFRINGILYNKQILQKDVQLSVCARIKILSNLDIAETRLPQDGSFQVAFAGNKIDFRVSTIPTNFGERIVLRVLDKSKFVIKLDTLGFDESSKEIFRTKLQNPNGIILVTGPTGSGKSTTLYAALEEIKDGKKNIITVEDPVEYQLSGINQIQVKPEIGLTFAAGLRSILRQDPDVIMIGEIRDEETMNIAIQSSLTGHLVFSTLHTNDSISTIVRLYNMGLKSYLISSSVICILAQRLVKILCPHCKEKMLLNDEYKIKFGLELNQSFEVYKEKGCEECNFTGFISRKGIFELLNIDEKIREMIMLKKHIDEIKTYCVYKKMYFLSDSVLDLFLKGETSVTEVLGIIYK